MFGQKPHRTGLVRFSLWSSQGCGFASLVLSCTLGWLLRHCIPTAYLSSDSLAVQFWVRALAPNTRYGFRVRAFNGFGPGVYAHQCFATRPARPAVPVAVRIAPTEVLLQWLFSSRNAAKVSKISNSATVAPSRAAWLDPNTRQELIKKIQQQDW